MSKKITNEDPVLVVKLQKGLADRQRLPLDHVIRVLEEVRQMVIDAGRELQQDMGLDKPKGDFGLELLAGADGVVFRKGSVQAQIAVTTNVQTGVLAAFKIVNAINSLGKKKFALADEADRQIIRRLNRIASIQETDKTEMMLSLRRPGVRSRVGATFSEAAIATASSMQAPVFQMEDTTLTGKLCELKDTQTEGEEEKGFWGELRRDNGEIWRIQFRPDDVRDAAQLFRRQARLTGTAKYYRITAPKLIVKDMALDTDRDYETAFDELLGCDKKIYPGTLADVLRDLRGDD